MFKKIWKLTKKEIRIQIVVSFTKKKMSFFFGSTR